MLVSPEHKISSHHYNCDVKLTSAAIILNSSLFLALMWLYKLAPHIACIVVLCRIMDSIPWSSSKTEENHGIFGSIGGERLGLYICAAGGALFGTMSWGAALASSRYAEEIRRSCAKNEDLLKKNASKFDDVVHRLSAVSSGLDGGVSYLNSVSGAMQRVWKQDIEDRIAEKAASAAMHRVNIAKLNEIAETAKILMKESADEHKRQRSIEIEDYKHANSELITDLKALTSENQLKISGAADAIEKQGKHIEAVANTLYTDHDDFRHNIELTNAATDKLIGAHSTFGVGVDHLNRLQQEWKQMNSEKIKMINELLHHSSVIPSHVRLQDARIKTSIQSTKKRAVSTSVAKARANDKSKSLGGDESSSASFDASNVSLSDSDDSFDPDIHDPTKYTLDEKTGKYKYALLED
jgi:hypothetical protein